MTGVIKPYAVDYSNGGYERPTPKLDKLMQDSTAVFVPADEGVKRWTDKDMTKAHKAGFAMANKQLTEAEKRAEGLQNRLNILLQERDDLYQNNSDLRQRAEKAEARVKELEAVIHKVREALG